MSMFNLSKKLTCVIGVLALLSPLMAAGADQQECMQNATTQQERNQCASAQLKAVDDELDRVYQAIRSKYKDDRLFLKKLRNAQRAWLTFLDAELGAKFPVENKQFEYGSVYPMCANLFRAQRILERIKHLREWLDGTEEGDVCAGSVQYKQAP